MPLWRIAVTLPDETAANVAANYLERIASAVTAFETTRDGPWLVQGFATERPVDAEVEASLALLAMVQGLDEIPVEIEKLEDIDWLKRNRESFQPFRIGRFFIHGSHVDTAPGGGTIPLRIDAATAFGTGEHATTHGCLLALDRLARVGLGSALPPQSSPASREREHKPSPACEGGLGGGRPHILDMGCGTAILAIAAAKLWRVPVIASDIDPHSVRVAAENISVNGVTPFVHAIAAPGYRAAAVRKTAPFSLVFANILARPLVAMAADLAAHLAPGGIAILSGLLADQERFVAAAHRAHGLSFIRRIPIDGWHTLVFRKPTAAWRSG